MNPQPVSLDFTSKVSSKPSPNTVKPPANQGGGEDNQFKKELKNQENRRQQDEGAKTKAQEPSDKKQPELVSEVEKRASVAAEDVQNGEALPESEAVTSDLIPQVPLPPLVDEAVPETLVFDNIALSLRDTEDYSATIESLNMSVVDGAVDGAVDGVVGGVVDQVNLLGAQSESGHVVIPGVAPSVVPGVAPGTIVGTTAPANTMMGSESALNTFNLDSEAQSQPVEKLMTLNQIKSSLENSLETMAELEIDVDLDAESSIKEVMRFNDVQLKENQSALKSYTTSVPLPLTQSAWGEQVSDKIVWLANQKIQFAEIHINPQELGPVEVKINVQNDQAAITFTSPHQGVRDLLEMNVNRLREMMSENGVDLTHVDVSDQSSQHESQGDDEAGGVGLAGVDGDSDLDGAEATTLALEQENLVDYYA